MYRPVVALLLLVSGWANALTLSPMHYDKLVYTNYHTASFKVENTLKESVEYDITVTREGLEGERVYRGRLELGGSEYRTIGVPIMDIEPDKLSMFYVCVQEKPGSEKWTVVGRTCAKLRLYWPLLELRQTE